MVGFRVLGVDAAGKHGWVGVVLDVDGFVAAGLAPALADLIAQVDAEGAAHGAGPVAVIGVDIPIGLVDGPRRVADVAARAFVGPRRASVFASPPRSAVGFDTQGDANQHLAARGLPMLSAQAMALVPRIREASAVAASDPRVCEVFPEASFCQMAGAHLPDTKKSAAGTLHRLELLARATPPVVLPVAPGPAGRVPMDDLFDAAAAAWSALRRAQGRAVALGDPDEIDPVTGRRIAVWV